MPYTELQRLKRREAYRRRTKDPAYRKKRNIQNINARRKRLTNPIYRKQFLAKKRAYAKAQRANQPEKLRYISRKSYRNNRKSCLSRAKKYKQQYRKTTHGRKLLKQWQKNYYLRNRDKILKRQKTYYRNKAFVDKRNKYIRKKYKTDVNYYLKRTISSRIRIAIKYYSVGKKYKTTEQILGCSVEKARSHIEKQFLNGMSWKNRHLWHIDHKIPCASFDLTKKSEQKKCFHFSNLQPLWAKDNLRKGHRLKST